MPKVGTGPRTVNVIVAVAAAKSPAAGWVAVITVVPKAKGVTVFLSIDATVGLDEVNVHAPGELDLGETRVKLATLSFVTLISPKVPSTGAIGTTVNFIDAVADFQFGVLD